MKILAALVLLAGLAFAQTATVGFRNTIPIPSDGQAIPVHLAWGPPTVPAGWVLYDYCVGRASVSGQEHAPTTIGGIVYKGCPLHATGTTYNVYPFLGPGFYVIWAEYMSTDGTKVALSDDSNEASCDLEVLSQTATSITFYCKDQVGIAPPTGVTATVQ